jgi:Domain of unknown function (DUF4386)
MNSRKHEARVAGVLYLLFGVTSALEMSIPSVFIVHGDAAATVGKIASSQLLYRLYVVSGLVSQILFVFLVLALYQLLKGVNRRQASLMVALVLVQAPMAFANTLCGLAPLVLSNGADYWSAFEKQQLNAMTMGVLSLQSYGTSAIKALWGLWLLPFGMLVFRSGFIPRIFGVFLVIGCFGWLGISVTSLLFPAYARIANQFTVLGVGEILIILWLVIMGARTTPLEGQVSDYGERGADDA